MLNELQQVATATVPFILIVLLLQSLCECCLGVLRLAMICRRVMRLLSTVAQSHCIYLIYLHTMHHVPNAEPVHVVLRQVYSILMPLRITSGYNSDQRYIHG